MSLKFNSGTDKISIADTVNLRNFTTFSILAWYNLLGSNPGAVAAIFHKGVDAINPAKKLWITTTGAISAMVDRATVDATNTSADGASDRRKWNFIAMTYNPTAGISLYHATDNTPPRLLAPASSAIGSGTTSNDATFPIIWGNEQDSDSPFAGLISGAGYWNRVLQLHEIVNQWGGLHPNEGCVDLHFLGRNNSNYRQEDFSGKGNYGIMTGTLVKAPSPIFPIIPPQEM